MAKVLLAIRPQEVRRGLPKAIRARLDAKLKRLVANPIPGDAISLNRSGTRYRIQVENLTIGYEFDPVQDAVFVKAILFDDDRADTGDRAIRKLLEDILSSR